MQIRSLLALGLIAGSIAAVDARADCAIVFIAPGVPDPTRVVCDGVDADGFAYDLPDVTLENFGTVRSPVASGSALFLIGSDNRVTNSGLIIGLGTAIEAFNSVTIRNEPLAQISGGAGPAIRANNSGTIINAGSIQSLAGSAIEAAFDLILTNTIGTIQTSGTADAISAGVDATVRNGPGGVIRAVDGAALRAASGLSFTNSGATVTNEIQGGAIAAGDGASITNTSNGEILSVRDTAIAVTTNATISNTVGGRISSANAAAISAQDGLDLTNTGARIEALGSDTVVDAGISATILNSFDGTISSRAGTSIVASFGLDLTNGPAATISSDLGLAVDAGMSARVRNRGKISGGLGGVELAVKSILDNDPGGLIVTRSGEAVKGTGRITITNGPGARIETEDGTAIALRDPTLADLVNHGELRSERGAAVSIGSGPDVTIRNRRDGEIRSVSGRAIVTRADRTIIENGGEILADETAIEQVGTSGRVELFNREGGRIESAFGAAVELRDGFYVNERRGLISGESAGLVASGGRLENSGRIEARDPSDGVGVRFGRDADGTEIVNDGEIVGQTGILFGDTSARRHMIDNAGLIEAAGGTAIRFGAARDGVTLQLRDGSEIFGNVLFGGSDDALDILDITSGSLITGGLFDGGAGIDTLSFASSFAASDFLFFEFQDALSVAITVTAEDSQSLYGLFRNFDRFLIGGTERSYAELRGAFAPPVAAVPIPSALPMLLAGLACLGLVARR